MNIKERLKEYLQERNIKISEFERTIEVSPTYVHKISSLGSDILARIKEEYPDIDLNWLVTGKHGETPKNSRTTTEWLSVTKSLTETINRLEKELKAERGKKISTHSTTGRVVPKKKVA